MTPEFIRLTNRDGGGDLFLRRDMVAAVGSFRDATHVTLVNEDIDYEVKETPEQVLRLLEGEEHAEEEEVRQVQVQPVAGGLPAARIGGKRGAGTRGADAEAPAPHEERRLLYTDPTARDKPRGRGARHAHGPAAGNERRVTHGI